MQATGSPYLQPGHFQLSVGFRGLKSIFHWTGYERNRNINSGVRNQQFLWDVAGTYQFTKQTSVTFSLPYFKGDWGFFDTPRLRGQSPTFGRKRFWTHSHGIGDITIVGQRWLLPTTKFKTGNVALGFGFSIPTGADDRRYGYPFPNGTFFYNKPVDVSIQPGLGGMGIISEISGFKNLFRRITLYGSGIYVITPRGSNGTPSILQGLVGPVQARRLLPLEIYNSVPDLYVGETGVAMAVPKVRGLAISGSARIEGSPGKDLIGSNLGFRRPGFVLFGVPGITYTYKNTSLVINIPIRALVNTQVVNIDHRHADATIPNWIFLGRLVHRF